MSHAEEKKNKKKGEEVELPTVYPALKKLEENPGTLECQEQQQTSTRKLTLNLSSEIPNSCL